MEAPIETQTSHQLSAEQVIQIQQSHPTVGLNAQQVADRREKFGLNVISGKKKQNLFIRFLLQFHQPLIYIMLASAVIATVLKEWVDASVIYLVVLANALIGLLQEWKASNAIEALAKTVVTMTTVVRDGKKRQLDSSELVPGDLVMLESGDRVPADIRVISARNLCIDESALTGESLPIEKSPEILDATTRLADRKNVLHASSLVTSGFGSGVVFRTGNFTEIGRISQLIASTQDLETPLTKKLESFSNFLLWMILGLSILASIVGVMKGYSVPEMLMAAVAIAVGAIPEGLPAAVTITLAIGVYRMAKRRAIIRKLPAVEALGSTTVICSDKTGTLTENQMTVRSIYAGFESFSVTGTGYAPEGSIEGNATGSKNLALFECLKAGFLCNVSLLVEKEGRWQVEGDPTEGALLSAALKSDLQTEALAHKLPRIDAIPFDPNLKFMATLHDPGPNQDNIVYLKGSIEALLKRCSKAMDAQGNIRSFDPPEILQQADELARSGLRVIALATTHLSAANRYLETELVESNLVFLGLQAMQDPPRQDAIAAVEKCRTAGIQVKMITGDHLLTAQSIARQMGILSQHAKAQDVSFSGHDLDGLSDEQLVEIAERATVFARVTPEEKLRLVRALQSKGHVVAMTGDGVNDAPALKQADIGISMGINGTEVAKEAAQLVLMDDNFATIEAAVEEGRGVFDNIIKFVIWTLPTNFAEGLVILFAIFMGAQLPILPVQILWINMTTAVLLGLMLAFEPKEAGIMERPPRSPQKPILTADIIWRIVSVGALLVAGSFGLFQWELSQGSSIEKARTMAVNLFVVVQTFYLFNCRSLTKSMFAIGVFSNPWVSAGVLLTIGGQLAYTYLPAMNRLFQSAPITARDWLHISLIGVLAYSLVGFEKWCRLKLPKEARPA